MISIITCTIPGLLDPSLAIAGSRAGELGVLDLTFCDDTPTALASINKLDHFAINDYGIKINAVVDHFFLGVCSAPPPRLTTVILTTPKPEQLHEAVSSLRTHKITIMLECTSLNEAALGHHCGVDAFIIKGNEAGGRVGSETSFILLQQVKAAFSEPVWVHGGIGLHTASACYMAGAAGVILDAQLCLARESSLSPKAQQILRKQDGRKTQIIGEEVGETYRIQSLSGSTVIDELHQIEQQLCQQPLGSDDRLLQWRRHLAETMTTRHPDEEHVFLMLGQDIAVASYFADTFITVSGIVQAIKQSVEKHCRLMTEGNPFSSTGAMAKSHNTKYALVQGPMARVSDTPQFALSVAQEGAIPFLAAAWLRHDELDSLFSATAKLLNHSNWGVGLLGFLPTQVFAEQLDVLIKHRPPFALLAGGQPHQAKRLEKEGIHTYVHIPTVSILDIFIDHGLRRFIFEGREAGGHVGPFCGFVLWETMIQRLLVHAEKSGSLQGFHILFAGGIKDSLSAAMLGVMTAPLTARGASVGLQIGSAYLFTKEAVTSGAIVPLYQQKMIDCQQTTLLETGPGHAVRCVTTPFATCFLSEKRRLLAEKIPIEEARHILEGMERGRLRIAAKGVTRSDKSTLKVVDEAVQHEEGIYMVGQMAALQTGITTIAELHHDLAINSFHKITAATASVTTLPQKSATSQPSDIAIIGIAGFFPLAPDATHYWNNIVNKVNAIREIPKERWDFTALFNENRYTPDRIYAKWGTFLDDIPFDPLNYGMPPKMIPSVEPLHLMALESVRHALRDAGYDRRPFDRERTAVTMGISGAGDLAQLYSFRTMLPMFFGNQADDIVKHFNGHLPEWTEDSFPGILMNVAAGRIANRFDFGGMNTLVDGACASSLAALYSAVKELETGSCDLAIAGGADCMQNPFTYMCFSKTHALSPRGVCNSLDAKADGIVIGESIVSVVLKRLADAERDGDKIYSVIKGMGASSDGRDRSLTAPGVKGQMRALKRAYAKAGFSPATVELMEAHATGTVEGDKIEIESLSQVLQAENTTPRNCAIGSVKSMIGHTKSAAGLASLVKTALALHHKVLPPTLGVETPNPGLQKAGSPLYVNGDPRPWFRSEHPRRAGVNAFGFGGTNYHTVLEEYLGSYYQSELSASYQDWPTELFCWQATDGVTLSEALHQFKTVVNQSKTASLKDFSHANTLKNSTHPASDKGMMAKLALIANSTEDLLAKIDQALTELNNSPKHFTDPRGLFYRLNSSLAGQQVAFLFPGQGSQYVNMMAELAIQFPWVQELFERSNMLLTARRSTPLSSVIFPAQVFTTAEQREQAAELAQTTAAQPAMGTSDLTIYHLLHRLGVIPDMVAGHSYGEYVALCVAKAIGEEDLLHLSEARARFILEGTGDAPGIMAAVEADANSVESLIAEIPGVWVANINAPDQVVISGATEAIQAAMKRFEHQEIKVRQLPVGCAFHSPLIKPSCAAMTDYLKSVPIQQPKLPVYSNVTAAPHSTDPASIKDSLVNHLVNRVRFVEQIENMYQAGARIFVECGPGRVLTGLVDKILGDRPHLAVVTNQRGRSAFTQLHFALAELFIHGTPIDLVPLFAGRLTKKCDQPQKKLSPTTWLVNGSGARPADKPALPPLTPFQFHDVIRKPIHHPVQSATDQTVVSSASHPSLENRDAALIGFQQLMRHFLDTQHAVMARYLAGANDETRSIPQTTSDDHRVTPPEPLPVNNETDSSDQPMTQILSPAYDAEAELMAVVSARTGYPPEMIDLDSDMEADLGIDSIKRVEILGEFLKGRDTDGERGVPPAEVEKARTLRQILSWAKTKPEPTRPSRTEDPPLSDQEFSSAPQPVTSVQPPPAFLPRCVVESSPMPLPSQTLPLPKRYPLLITDDGHGIAETLAGTLHENGCEVLLLRSCKQRQLAGNWTEYFLDQTATASLADLIKKRHAGISGFIHLSPLQPMPAPFAEINAAEWQQRLISDIKPMFALLQYFADDLKDSRGVVAAATAMGGTFGLDDAYQQDFFPGQGALSGFMKTLAIEWPEVRVKVIDTSPADPVETIAHSLFAELITTDEHVEIGLFGGNRYGLVGRLAPLPQVTETELHPDSDWVIVITGGARGITARVAIELAERFQPTLILLGRSPAPAPGTNQEFSHLSSALEIKQAIIKQSQEQKLSLTIAEVEDSCRRLLAEREISAAMTRMQQAGSRVVYHQVDVNDSEKFSALLTSIHQQYGAIDGIIHGAGIIEDKLFVDKKWESFARVFFTKANSTWTIANALPTIAPRFVAFFSSVAGTFGNRGQCDYSAANEVMNKTALWLNRHWSGRSVALNWGPWAGSGMATPEVQEQFLKRQVHLVGQDEGALAFVREITYGQQNEVEILLGDGPWVALANLPAPSTLCPLLQGITPHHNDNHPTLVPLTLDPQTHLYLDDHRLDGRPVLPAAVAVEIMAETAATLNPGWQVTAIREVRVLKGIVIEQERLQIVISAHETTTTGNNFRRLTLGISTEEGGRLSYSGIAELHQSPPPVAVRPLPVLGELHPLGMSINETYDKWLFHGPLFQCITSIEGINDHGLRATLKTSKPGQCLQNVATGNWLTDPILLDGGLQLALIWTRFHRDMTMLPSAMAAVHLYQPFSLVTEVSCQLEVVESVHQHGIIFNLYFIDQKGVLLGMIERLEATGSKELNRLTEKAGHTSEGDVI
ncbi:MAG: SDR family NAD(P)-dependent oxidoreductase [Proteobacteria bacterium]|nr:SDR family NAD(P)-dependent oxidoreductase [Pseudomonadota bacterium]